MVEYVSAHLVIIYFYVKSRIGQPNVMDIREDNKKRENTLTAFRPSFRGNATMTLSVIPDSLAKEAWIRFDIHAESSSKSIIKWAVDKATTQKIRFIVFNAYALHFQMYFFLSLIY